MKIVTLWLLLLNLFVKSAHSAPVTNEIALTRFFSIQAHGVNSRVAALAFSPDNKILASGSGTTDALLSHGEIKLWNATNGTLIAELKGHGGLVDAIVLSPDGKFVVGGGYRLILWDVAKRKKVKTMKPGGLVHALAFSPDGKFLVSACRGLPYAQIWDVETGREQRKLNAGKDNEQTVWSVDFSTDGALLAMGGSRQPATIWNVKNWLHISALTNAVSATDCARHVEFSPDGAFVVTAGMDHLNLWEVKTGRRIQSVKGNFWSVAFSPDGKLLAVGKYGGGIQVFRVGNLKVEGK